jgi:hypothetical protein
MNLGILITVLGFVISLMTLGVASGANGGVRASFRAGLVAQRNI